jgi:hypothetical protein
VSEFLLPNYPIHVCHATSISGVEECVHLQLLHLPLKQNFSIILFNYHIHQRLLRMSEGKQRVNFENAATPTHGLSTNQMQLQTRTSSEMPTTANKRLLGAFSVKY